MSHGIYTNESWHTHVWVMSHIWIVCCVPQLCRARLWTRPWVVAHIGMRISHVIPVNESCHIYESTMSIVGCVSLLFTVCQYVMQCVAVCCSVLQCVAVCCNVLQCFAVCKLCVATLYDVHRRLCSATLLRAFTTAPVSHDTHWNEKESYQTCQWVMPHMRTSQVTYVNRRLCVTTLSCVFTTALASHGTHVNKSRLTYEWVTAYIWMSQWVVYLRPRSRVVAHIGMRRSHVKHFNNSCYICERTDPPKSECARSRR